MSQLNTWRAALVASSLAALFAFSIRASGDDKKTNAAFATVDFNKISNDYKSRDAVEQKLKAKQAMYNARLDRRDSLWLLTEDEQKQLDALHEKEQPSDGDKAKIKELEEKAAKLQNDLQALSQKKDTDLKEDEKKKLQDANNQRRDATQRLAASKENWAAELDHYGSQERDALMTNVRQAISKVAEQKGVAVVFNSEVAPYAGNDITSQVVGELNKKPIPPG